MEKKEEEGERRRRILKKVGGGGISRSTGSKWGIGKGGWRSIRFKREIVLVLD